MAELIKLWVDIWTIWYNGNFGVMFLSPRAKQFAAHLDLNPDSMNLLSPQNYYGFEDHVSRTSLSILGADNEDIQ